MQRLKAPLGALVRRLWRFGQAELGPLAALAVAAWSLTVFLDIAEDMGEGDGRMVDEAVLAFLRPGDPHTPWGPPWLSQAMSEITALGGVTVLSLVAVLAVGFLLLKRRYGSSALIALSLLGGLALSQGLKHLFGRERPPLMFRADDVANPSFPSGHAMLSTVVYLTLGALLAQSLDKKRLRAFVFGAAALLAFLIGLSRIYLAVHWTSDVLAGWALGTAWAIVCWLAAYLLERGRRA